MFLMTIFIICTKDFVSFAALYGEEVKKQDVISEKGRKGADKACIFYENTQVKILL